MAMTRSMTAKQNQNASSRKRRKTVDNNDDSSSWSYMFPDILFSIILRLGVVDFITFSGVCKSWRTVAHSNRNMFMLSRQPMPICISTQVARRKVCYLEDSEGRKFKTILPRSSGKTCLGLICGYLILFGRLTRDFVLVNPISRHELYFPRCPFRIVPDPEAFRCALVFSQTMSSWVFVISTRFSRRVSFAFSNKHASWTHLFSESPICDLHFFQGKIYTLNIGIHLCELRLGPEPALLPLKMKNLVSELMFPEFESMGGKLYVIGYCSKAQYGTVEVDSDQMRWMNQTEGLKEYVCFASILKYGFTKLEFWTEPRELYDKFGYFHGTDNNNNNNRFRVTADMWYCLHKCLDVNILHE